MLALGILLNSPISGQVDSVFWFAAPNFTDGHGDIPIYMRFTTLNDSAEVIVDQPANPQFVPITFEIAPNASYSLNLMLSREPLKMTFPMWSSIADFTSGAAH